MYYFYLNKHREWNNYISELVSEHYLFERWKIDKTYVINNIFKLWNIFLFNNCLPENPNEFYNKFFWDNRIFENFKNLLVNKENEEEYRKIISTIMILSNLNYPNWIFQKYIKNKKINLKQNYSNIINCFINNETNQYYLINQEDSDWSDGFMITNYYEINRELGVHSLWWNPEYIMGNEIELWISPSYLSEISFWSKFYDDFILAPIYDFTITYKQLIKVAQLYFTQIVENNILAKEEINMNQLLIRWLRYNINDQEKIKTTLKYIDLISNIKWDKVDNNIIYELDKELLINPLFLQDWYPDFLKNYWDLMKIDTTWAFPFEIEEIFNSSWDEESQKKAIREIDKAYGWNSWIHYMSNEKYFEFIVNNY
ncbi:MAG: hypothetical protein ACD_4C00012G0002 [uncultured bacterium (gcode 4)]|uniref:Uncharacterized protein n=1 Tax=uncultured bacterium (gcode 4) TaxID=1234023 RepID=K2FW55_9BACT|nr:MAG: hypothetical protein ACD_4C00012G0002 [uncultured bacterium (gcode 4)]